MLAELGTTHGKQMADAHWQADSQRCWALQVSALGVTGRKNGEDKLKGDEEFNHQGMTSRDMNADLKRGRTAIRK